MPRDPQSFHAAYRAWLDAALQEFNTRFGSVVGARRFHQETTSEHSTPDDIVEFAEDGDAYPHSRAGGTGHIRHAVTAWADSPHFQA